MDKENKFTSEKIKVKINIEDNIKKNSEIITKKEHKDILEKFKKYGVLYFSNFSSNIENLTKFIDLFSESYSHDARRRTVRFDNRNIRSVDVGYNKITLHSETSFSPSRPEIIWLYCVSPPKTDSGKTILCDGLRLWDSLSSDVKIFFLGDPICYTLKIPVDEKIKGKGKKRWYLDNQGVRNCYLNFKSKSIEFEYIVFAVQKNPHIDKLCFANHILIPVKNESQIISRKMYNGKKIPKKIIDEIRKKAASLTKAVHWKKNDLFMIDNGRYMHGREAIDPKEDARDIITMQTAKSKLDV